LLSIAFEGETHIPLVRLSGITAEAIKAMLEAKESKSVTSLGLCIGTLQSTPVEILDPLCQASSLRELYFLDQPTRTSDHLSTELFLEICKKPQLFRDKVVIAGTYSSPLRRRLWLPNSTYRPPSEVFPIQQMFFRRNTGSFEPRPFYFGDKLLRPEAFAACFLTWLRKLDDFMVPFSAGPRSLQDMSGVEVSPISAEKYSIPVHPRPGARRCWPKIRELETGSWTVLVSEDVYRDPEAQYWQPSTARFVKYAFVRPRVLLTVGRQPLSIPPDDLEVVGLEGFLLATAPHVDQVLVHQRLTELTEYLATRPHQARLGRGLKWLSVLELIEARAIVEDFLSYAVRLHMDLVSVMRDMPQGEPPGFCSTQHV
jgi:hypothetical protein